MHHYLENEWHPLVPELNEAMRTGKISRREFLRFSTLLGLSLASAQYMAACIPAPPTETPAASAAPIELLSPSLVRGGALKAATRVERVDHPARFSRISQAHAWRHVLEYLTYTNSKGITTPYLLDKWETSEDLKTWTLYLKKGIKFNNGKELTAADVLFNFGQWLNKDIGSSLLGSLSYLDPNGQEKIDDTTIVCHLKSPTIYLPEHLFSYPALIVPQEFGGDISREPIGTGAFTIAEYVPGERCRLAARKDYWRTGRDGKPLPYLDEILLVQLGEDRSADLAALQTGQVDTIIEPTVAVWEALKNEPKYEILSTPTSATRTLRLRVDQDPWTDHRVRQALKLCQDRPKILAVALQNQGTIGNDSHVAPAHPEYMEIAPFPFDVARSKALLAEAGLKDGVTVELAVSSDWPESLAFAQVLKEDAAAGGFTINLKTMPASEYWDGWTEWNMGITWWSHRSLAPMTLPLAYIANADGEPVPWNESRWVDEEFSAILKEAEATLDLSKRKELVGRLEQIQRDRGSVLIPFFMNVWKIYDKKFHGIVDSPEEYAIFYETWKEN